MERYNNSITNIPNFRVPAWAPVNYYSTVVYPILKKEGWVFTQCDLSISQLNFYCFDENSYLSADFVGYSI